MPKITAIIHTHDDAPRIGRALESLRSCDELLVVDHQSSDDTLKIARQYGAKVKAGVPGVSQGAYVVDAGNDWILCILPSESLSEALEASLFEWKTAKEYEANSFSIRVREETAHGWHSQPPETRLINRKAISLTEALPPNDPNAQVLVGDLLRFRSP